MDYIYRVAAQQLFGVKVAEGPLPMRALRNTDFQEVTLEVSHLLRAHARASGSQTSQALCLCISRGLACCLCVSVMSRSSSLRMF